MQGMLGIYHELDAATDAIDALKRQGYTDITVFTPTPRHELEHAMAHGESPVRRFTLIGGILGCTFGYWIAIWASDYWPLVVGGKAIASWIPYTIFGFEVMVLIGALATVFGMFANSRIPRLVPTLGYDPRFSAGDYGVFVATAPEQLAAAEQILRSAGAAEVRRER